MSERRYISPSLRTKFAAALRSVISLLSVSKRCRASPSRSSTNFTAASEGITPDKVIERLLQETPSREGELTRDPRLKKIFSA